MNEQGILKFLNTSVSAYKVVHDESDFIKGLLSLILGFNDSKIEMKLRTRFDDAKAISSDWEKVGGGVRRSMDTYSREKALV